MTKKYDESRPRIPAEIRREVEVESGHQCAVKNCNEHTYLEIHHIDENRENNALNNLILLCDKHHKMAHAKVIDRKALREYKVLLKQTLLKRRLDKGAEKEIIECLKSYNKSRIAFASTQGDSEASNWKKVLISVFEKAGWKVEDAATFTFFEEKVGLVVTISKDAEEEGIPQVVAEALSKTGDEVSGTRGCMADNYGIYVHIHIE